jgi:hypothetical protein
LQLFDEAAFYQDLIGVESALLPSLQTTGGRALYLSTPPLSTAHPYVQRCYAASAAGLECYGTFRENPRVNVNDIESAEMARLGLTLSELRASTYYRREYLAEIVTDESRAALPSWTRERAATLTLPRVREQHYDGYVALDFGGTGDPHAALFAEFSHETKKLHVVSELELRSASTTIAGFAGALKERERELWGVERYDGTLAGSDEWAASVGGAPEYLRRAAYAAAPRQPFLRVADNNPLALVALNAEHMLGVVPSRRDDKAVAVDALNQLLVDGRIIIAPECRRLLTQMQSATWNRSRSEWERTATDHADLIDCLLYLSRSVSWHRDERPKHVPDMTLLRERGGLDAWGKRLRGVG